MKYKLQCLITVVLIVNIAGLSYAQKTTDKVVNELLNNAPKPTQLTIEYREIVGLRGSYAWHIGDSVLWIRLHPKEIYDVEKLDKTKKYQITCIVLEQNYGTIDVWVKRIQEIRGDSVDSGDTPLNSPR